MKQSRAIVPRNLKSLEDTNVYPPVAGSAVSTVNRKAVFDALMPAPRKQCLSPNYPRSRVQFPNDGRSQFSETNLQPVNNTVLHNDKQTRHPVDIQSVDDFPSLPAATLQKRTARPGNLELISK